MPCDVFNFFYWNYAISKKEVDTSLSFICIAEILKLDYSKKDKLQYICIYKCRDVVYESRKTLGDKVCKVLVNKLGVNYN